MLTYQQQIEAEAKKEIEFNNKLRETLSDFTVRDCKSYAKRHKISLKNCSLKIEMINRIIRTLKVRTDYKVFVSSSSMCHNVATFTE